ncbi:UPAR/Ly6 domain-containing protein bou-like isoform X2 [Argopecten irradians]|uniref:UPAR/Ly6 domain-containing protein bou-like isoform X2 n=1 Tax=Argopecten irradians TaxID=31199 RepID=UPI00371CAE45
MQNLYHLGATIVVILTTISTVQGLNCFQCNSTLDHNCQEHFDHDFTINPLSSQYCTVWNSRYCIKITGLWGGVVGTHRFCSSRDLGDQCQDIFYPDHDRMYRACVYTCTSDDCNAATSMWTKWTLVVSIVLAFFSYKISVL